MKNKKNKLVIPILVLVVIVGIGLFLSQQKQVSGFTTLSLSQAQFLSNINLPNGNFWNEKLWILTVLQNGMQQQAWISTDITPNELEMKSGTRPTNTLSLDVLYSEQNCEWDIVKSGEGLYSYEKKGWSCILDPFNAESQLRTEAQSVCGSNVFFYANQINTVFGVPNPGDYCYCWTKNKVGEIGRYSYSEKVHTKATIEVSTPEKSKQTVNFDTKEANAEGYIGSNIFYKWNGYISQDTCPNADDYHPYWFGSNWKLAPEQSYISYSSSKGTVESIPDTYSSKHLLSLTDLNAIVGKFENVNYAKNNVVSQDVSFGTLADKTNSEHSILKAALDRPIANLLFTFYIKAAWVGIYQPLTDLKLGDVTCATADKTTSSYVTASVVNNGDAVGAGNLALSCDSPIEARDSSLDINVPPKTTNPYKLWWQVATPSTVDKTCRVKLSSPSLTTPITKTVTCRATPMITCTAGNKQCDGNKIVQCNSQGSGYSVLVENCESSKTCKYDDSGNPYCRSGVIPPIPPKTCEEKSQRSFLGLFNYPDPIAYLTCVIDEFVQGVINLTLTLLKLVMSSTLAVIVASLANKNLGKKAKKKDRNLYLILSILLGLLAGYVAWVLVVI